MNNRRIQKLIATCFAIFVASSIAFADDFDITSYTIDGGGGYSAGGSFELEGTIGQPDAGFMAGGAFDLEGGFWPQTTLPSCACLGDMNGDGARDGADIQQFVACLIDGGSCACADIDGMAGIDEADTTAFVSNLLSGSACP